MPIKWLKPLYRKKAFFHQQAIALLEALITLVLLLLLASLIGEIIYLANHQTYYENLQTEALIVGQNILEEIEMGTLSLDEGLSGKINIHTNRPWVLKLTTEPYASNIGSSLKVLLLTVEVKDPSGKVNIKLTRLLPKPIGDESKE